MPLQEPIRSKRPTAPQRCHSSALAKLAQAPIQTIFIDTDSPYLGKGWPLWRLPKEKIKMRMTVGEPLRFPEGGEAQAFLDELRQRYLMALQSPMA